MVISGRWAASWAMTRPPIEWPAKHGPADPQLLHHRAHERGVVAQMTTRQRQALRAAVAGHVDGHHLEPRGHQPGQGVGVEEPLGGEPVDHHQGDAPTAHGQAHPMAVGQLEGVTGQGGHGPVAGAARAVRLGGRCQSQHSWWFDRPGRVVDGAFRRELVASAIRAARLTRPVRRARVGVWPHLGGTVPGSSDPGCGRSSQSRPIWATRASTESNLRSSRSRATNRTRAGSP